MSLHSVHCDSLLTNWACQNSFLLRRKQECIWSVYAPFAAKQSTETGRATTVHTVQMGPIGVHVKPPFLLFDDASAAVSLFGLMRTRFFHSHTNQRQTTGLLTDPLLINLGNTTIHGLVQTTTVPLQGIVTFPLTVFQSFKKNRNTHTHTSPYKVSYICDNKTKIVNSL